MAGDALWGDGYVPRVSRRSRAGVDLALAPDLLNGRGPAPTWAIVDAPTAESQEGLVAHLRDLGVRVLVDTQAWRYADTRTFESPRWAATAYRPQSPFVVRPAWVRDYVSQDLLTQARLGASAVLLPGWFTALASVEDAANVASWVLEGYEAFRRRGSLLRAVSWLPVRLTRAAAVRQAAGVLGESGMVVGVVAQCERVSVLRDPVDRLVSQINLMLEIQSLSLPVLAGRFGSIGVTVRAAGVAAAECGPADEETFNATAMIRNSLPKPSTGSSKGGPPSSKIWLSELGQTVPGKTMVELRGNRRAHAEVVCRRPCHQFRRGPDSLNVAAWHSTLARLDEAARAAALPPSMRVDAARRHLAKMAEAVESVNHAASEAGGSWQVLRGHVDVQQAVLAHVSARHGAA